MSENETNLSNKKLNTNTTDFFRSVAPIKLTESRRIKVNTVGWGLITDYYLESVKINCVTGQTSTIATLIIGDRSGQVVCIVRGLTVGLLFGLSLEQWAQMENMCNNKQQLFYRYFKNGLSSNFNYEQKLFYNFCLSNQKKNVLVAVFRRGMNKRNKDRNDAFLEIIELRECNSDLMDLYVDYLRTNRSEKIIE